MAGVSAFAVAAGFAVTAGAGMASAAPGSVNWYDGGSTFTRTISNVTPAEDEIISVSTTFGRVPNAETGNETIQEMTDVHPACLTFMDLKVDGVPTALTNSDPTSARVVGSWLVTTGSPGHTMEYSYKVGANCDRNVALNTYMHYSGSLGAGNYPDKGPSISVTKNVSTTVLGAVSAGVKVGQSVPLSATVTGGADGNIVEFFDGTTNIGQGPLAAGAATLAWTPTTTGDHSLTAKFLGTAKANESVSAAQNVPVSLADVVTTTSVTGPATAVEGTDVVLGVQVSPLPSGGTVQFKDGAADLGAPVTLDAEGKASITRQFATTGAHNITAVYAGAGEFLTSTSGAHTINITAPDVVTSTVLTVPATATKGAAVNLVATVSPTPAGGTVQFMDGITPIGAPVTLDAEGKATLSHAFPTTGDHHITAVYSGAPGHLGSTAQVRTATVTDAGTGGNPGNASGSLGNLFGS
ncbi:Ig-like domain repeat protein [Rhodococcus oryzae]|uniref:Ig-like domain repeat protein n=1 Tax=Rhodococcus oryzae TaxID=2571143 RepID=A0ABY2RJK5_9NOCA|nr:Ig-like domain-containing protein [Rhodococcus oryzae]TJZ77859.1 Ig-like domain repeat protein [Rhodococcus oryzae]